MDRNIRNVGKAYKDLIRSWRDVLPASSMCLAVPIVPPSKSCWPNFEEAERFRDEEPATSGNPEIA
jgi:beta-glucosidase